MYCPVLCSNWNMYFRQLSISSTFAVSLNRYLRCSKVGKPCASLEGTSRGLLAHSHTGCLCALKVFCVAGLLSRQVNTARKVSLKANRTHPGVKPMLHFYSNVAVLNRFVRLVIQSNGAWHNMDIHLDSMQMHGAKCRANFNLNFGETLI